MVYARMCFVSKLLSELTGFSFSYYTQLEMMQAVSFLYVKPPGYNAESAKAAEVADEKRKLEQSLEESSSSM